MKGKRIKIGEVIPGMKLAAPILDYLGRELIKGGVVLKDNLIVKLKVRGVPEVLIMTEEGEPEEEKKKKVDRLEVLFKQTHNKAIECTRRVMQNLETGGTPDEEEEVKNVVKEMVSRAISSQNILTNLVYLKSYDNYLYTHSVNTCALSLIIGVYLDYSRERLFELGVGSLLHDLGMTKVPRELYDHPGAVTTEQFEAIKKHTLYGRNLIKQMKEISSSAIAVAYQHHERADGSGYPRGITNLQIHQFARIVAVSDVYEALISARRYRRERIPAEAMRTVLGEGNLFDSRVVRAFLGHMSIYPVRSVVVLNNEEIGLVIGTRRNFPFRPQIKVIFDSEGNRLESAKLIDLSESEYTSLYIAKTIDEKTLDLDLSEEL